MANLLQSAQVQQISANSGIPSAVCISGDWYKATGIAFATFRLALNVSARRREAGRLQYARHGARSGFVNGTCLGGVDEFDQAKACGEGDD